MVMPLPISPDPASVSRSSSPDDAPPREPSRFRRIAGMTGRAIAASAAAGFACVTYAYLTLPDVRPLRSTNPPTTAFIELRSEDARTRGETPRRVQRWVRYRDISADLKRAVLV